MYVDTLKITKVQTWTLFDNYSLNQNYKCCNNYKKWRSIDPESELAAAVLETMDGEIEETQHWSKGKQLPLYPLFLLDVFESLKRELSVDYIFPEEKSADILERKHSRKDNYH